MIHRVHISWGFASLDADMLTQLHQLANARSQQEWSRTCLTVEGDPAVNQIESLLRGAGVRTLAEVGNHRQSHYELSRTRVWEQSDLDVAEYLWLQVKKPTIGLFVEREGSQVLCTQADGLPKGRVGLAGWEPAVFCPDAIRQRLEAATFRHLRFGVLKIKRRSTGPDLFEDVPGHTPWWQLQSDRELPAMCEVIERSIVRGSMPPLPTTRDHRGNVVLSEPPFGDLQPRYLESEWRERTPFDVAASYERTGIGEFGRMLVVSKRFYDFCEREGLKADWVPVRIDPD